MTTTTFMKEVEKLGYIAYKPHDDEVVVLSEDRRLLLIVAVDDIIFKKPFHSEDEQQKSKLLNLATKYVQTSLNKREADLEQFYIILNLKGVDAQFSYLNTTDCEDIFFDDNKEENGAKTIFNNQDVKRMPVWVQDFLKEGKLLKEEVI